MLFEEAAKRYMDDKRKRLRACTLEGCASALRCHLHPRWDGFELAGAAAKAYKTLRQIIRWAIRKLKLRMYDPTMAGIELPRALPYRTAVMDAGGVQGYLRALWGHECEAVAICSVTLGLSRGEACGLKWSDINLKTGEVRIHRSRQTVAGRDQSLDRVGTAEGWSYRLTHVERTTYMLLIQRTMDPMPAYAEFILPFHLAVDARMAGRLMVATTYVGTTPASIATNGIVRVSGNSYGAATTDLYGLVILA